MSEAKSEESSAGGATLNALLERMTASDRDAVAALPAGWFVALDLPYPRVKRAEYRCERLEQMGVLETRVTGAYPRLKREYRLRSNN